MFNILSLVGGSTTLGLAASLIPVLGRAFDLNKADDWVYGKLPENVKEKGTLEEFDSVLQAGKAFVKACYDFIHK